MILIRAILVITIVIVVQIVRMIVITMVVLIRLIILVLVSSDHRPEVLGRLADREQKEAALAAAELARGEVESWRERCSGEGKWGGHEKGGRHQ